MKNLLVVNNPKLWHVEAPGMELVGARQYLTDPAYGTMRHVRVFNVNKSYRYQSVGYYVSLLAAARGHRAFPTVAAMQDMKSPTILRFVSEQYRDLLQKTLGHLGSGDFELSIYFGRNVSKHYDALAWRLYNEFLAPMMRASFHREESGWHITSIRSMAGSDVPESHWPQVREFAEYFFLRPRPTLPKESAERFDIAILTNPKEKHPPSNAKAIAKFEKAAKKLGFYVECITRDDYGRLAEFDALFIRDTTNVNHYTYRFAQRAQAEGLVVIDDPESILRCTNKVFLAELLTRHRIAIPKTMIIHGQNIDQVADELAFPCILKQPDSSFSQGVFKVDDRAAYLKAVAELLEKSELVIAQEYMRTDFDWRVGIIDRKPLYVCRYHMAKKNWKIQHTDASGETHYGSVDAIPLSEAPEKVLQTALKAANLIGDGLYGVDLKQVGNRVVIVEVNDNPSIDCGFEDSELKDELYNRIMQVFLDRILKGKELRDHE